MSLSRTLGPLLVTLLVACKAQPQDHAVSEAGAAPAPAFSASAAAAANEQPFPAGTAASAAIASVVDEAVGGGADAGLRKRRRLTTKDAGPALVAEGVVAALGVAAASGDVPSKAKKVRGAPSMSDDEPYGGSAGSGAPVLKKTPLPSEDPWVGGGAGAPATR